MSKESIPQEILNLASAIKSKSYRDALMLNQTENYNIWGDILKLETPQVLDDQDNLILPRGIYQAYIQENGWLEIYLISSIDREKFLLTAKQWKGLPFEFVMSNPQAQGVKFPVPEL